jgi:hypothetical protein
MPIIYQYDSPLNIIHVRPYGLLSLLDIGNYFNKVAKDPDIKTEIIEIVHFNNVKDFLFSSSEAIIIPKMYRKFKDKTKLKGTIFIGESDIHFGISRMLQNILEMNDLQDGVFVVRNEEGANMLIKEINS